MSSSPPAPLHLLRSHSSPISAIHFSDDNERIYSADGTGKVIITSTRSLRPISSWPAHTDSILGVEEWATCIVTHGRDNKLHVWQQIEELPPDAHIGGGSAGLTDLPKPTLCYSMDVNALNFCRFSLLKFQNSSDDNAKPEALIALPNLIDSSTADVWSLPSLDRIHAAIGQQVKKSIFSTNAGGRNTSGIIMSLHLFHHSANNPSSSSSQGRLRIVVAYEDGSVVLRECTRNVKEASIEGEGWEIIFKKKLHVESIMAMKVSSSNDFALTVSADHIVGRYDLTGSSKSPSVTFRTKHPGNGSIAIRDDGKVCAVGGWDGKIRLYSTKSFKPLGTLKYHKSACQCLEFARALTPSDDSNPEDKEIDDDDDELTAEELLKRSRWLIAGSKDNRISIWSLISFEKDK